MATPAELSELKHGDGAWENIQEVLRFGFRRLWKVFAGVDNRVTELEKRFAAQQNDLQRQQQHLEAIAKTLNAMSEQLRVEQEETTNLQVEARLRHLECQFQDSKDRTTVNDDSAATKDCITKIERRLDLLEEEMGHVVSAIDQKADTEVMLAQTRSLEEAMRKRCKKEAFDQEVLALQERLKQQQQELEKELSTSISEFRVAQETLLHSEVENWAVKMQDHTRHNVQAMLDQETQQQGEILGAMDIQIKLCCEALEAQQKRVDDFQVEVEEKVRVTIAANREDVARQCSEAHGRIDYQFRTQEESLERVLAGQHELRENIAATENKRAQQTIVDIAAAVDALDRRVFDRGQQEHEKMHRQLTEEVQLMIANELKALELAKDREQRKLKQHQHVVGRKLAELDQMMQLIGRQLIQNTSQLQVVRNEQLEHDFHMDLQNEGAAYDDDASLLHYDTIVENTVLAEVSPALILPRPQYADQPINTVPEANAELQARRSQHQELQEQLNRKLRDYRQVLDPNQQQAKVVEKIRQPAQSPKK